MMIRNALKLIAPPILLQIYNSIRYRFPIRKTSSNKLLRPCHFNELFISHNGDIFPCCRTWDRNEMRIGHLSDENLNLKLKRFYHRCECGEYKLRPATIEDIMSFNRINIEMSLACQGNCAMCCVNAPEWKGQYDYYKDLTTIIDKYKPEEIMLQGGEVLIQKKSMAWISQIRESYPDMRIFLVTNGNVGAATTKSVANMIDKVTISFVGFQPETYKMIMGMEIHRAKLFAQMLSERNVKLNMKFLITASNIHEAGLFLGWAVSLIPLSVVFADSSTESYINRRTNDRYWDKVFARSADSFQTPWRKNKQKLLDENIKVGFDKAAKEIFQITDEFIAENGLESIFFFNF